MKSTKELLSDRLLGPRTKEEINLLVPRKKTQAETDRIADYLVEALEAPAYRPGFCKVAWRLDTGTIHKMAGVAREVGKNRAAYFMTCAKNEMRRRGVI